MKRSRGAIVATLAAGLLWGSSFAVIKLGLRSIDPYWFVFLRFSIASLVALAVSAASGRLPAIGAMLRSRLVIWLGVSNAAGFAFQFKGQTLTTAGNAALIVNAGLLFVAVASRFVFKERFGPLKVLAVVAGIAGVYLVTTGGSVSVSLGSAFRGDMLVLGAAFLWTFFVILDKKIVSGGDIDIRALTGAMVIVTALTSLPIALVLGAGQFPGPSRELWAVPYTAVFCTVIPFFLWTWGLKSISATTSGVILLVEVVFALALAAAMLGERLSPGALVGSALILLAVGLVSREGAEAIPAGPNVVPE